MTATERPARMPLVAPTDAADRLQAVYAEVGSSRGGTVGNVFRSMAASPGALQALAGVGAYFRAESAIPPRERELLVLAVAHELRCGYEWTHHLRVATTLGLSVDDVADALRASPDERVRVVVDTARAIATGTHLDDEDVERLRAALGDEVATEVVVMAAYYVALARVIDAFAVPLEPGVEAAPCL